MLEKKRIGRPKGLASWSKDLKHDWIFKSKSDLEQKVFRELCVLKSGVKGQLRKERLAQATADYTREAGAYHTSLEEWTCSCPSYLISRFLLCKHLVRLTENTIGSKAQDLAFFRKLRRNHRPPYYCIPGIHPDLEATQESQQMAGSVVDAPIQSEEIHELSEQVALEHVSGS